jgi:signal transduction histidine kinase
VCCSVMGLCVSRLGSEIPRKDEPRLTAEADARSRRRLYALPVDRPLTTAFGWRLPPLLLDVGPVALIAVEGALAIGLRPNGAGVSIVELVVVLVVSATALLFRYRSPLPVLAVVLVVTVAVDYGPIVTLPLLLAVFTVAEYCDRTRVIGAALVAATALIVAQPLHGHLEGLPAILSRLVAVGLAVAVGQFLRARADYVSGLQERAERLEREQELLAREAVGEERLRIARELHDVVAHNVSLMVVQSQALAATSGAGSQPGLGRIASLGREALSEMHHMLGLLRLQEGGAAEREPQPGVRDVRRLVERARQAGLKATLAMDGEPRELSPGVELSAYRIVQEALTNVVRHANAEHVAVRLRFAPEALHVTVRDDGNGPATTSTNGSAGGHGLLGMRERVALFGGVLEAGPGEDGHGYRVHASLPLR